MRKALCYDCGEDYGSPRFPDLVLSHEAWKIIAPVDGDGLLCPNCINARLEDVGLKNVHAVFRSGPMANYDTGELTPQNNRERLLVDEARIWVACKLEELILKCRRETNFVELVEAFAAGLRSGAEKRRQDMINNTLQKEDRR